MKKALCICAAAIMSLSLFACGTKTTKTRVANVPYSTTRMVRNASQNMTRAARRTVRPATRNTTTRNTATRNTANNAVTRNTITRNAQRDVTMRNYYTNPAIPNPGVRSVAPYTLPGMVPQSVIGGAPVYTGNMSPFGVVNP